MHENKLEWMHVLLVPVIGYQLRVKLAKHNCNSFTNTQIDAANVSEIIFNNKRRLSDSNSSLSKRSKLSTVRKPLSEDETKIFYDKLSKAKAKPAVLKITMPYAEELVPKLSNTSFPTPISELYNSDMLSCDYIQLLSECEKVFEKLKVCKLLIIILLHMLIIDNKRSCHC